MAHEEKTQSELLKEIKKMTGLDLALAAGTPSDEEDTIRALTFLRDAVRREGSRESVLARYVTGAMGAEEFRAASRRLHLDTDGNWLLYYVKLDRAVDEIAVRIVKQGLADHPGLLVFPAGEQELGVVESWKGRSAVPPAPRAAVRDSRQGTDAAYSLTDYTSDTAETILALLNTELLTGAKVAISARMDRAERLQKACQDTMFAMRIGSVFYPDRAVHRADSLGAGQLLIGLPQDTCLRFLRETIGCEGPDELPAAFDGDELLAAEAFLENDLNIAETARRLHVHRNTLLYRLDRIRQEAGLDIRRFDDAMKYRLCRMVLSVLRNR